MQYVCIEGCMGAGKTTLASLLSKKLNKEILLEDFERHPFLDDFYTNQTLYTFETEVCFLLMHYHQTKKALTNTRQDIISDYYIGKDMLFAYANLNSRREQQLFKNMYSYLSEQLKKPELIIHLKASDELILERIKNRGRENEKEISIEYITKLNKLYDKYFSGTNKDIEIITVDVDKCDFLLGDTIDEFIFQLKDRHWL